MGLTKVIDREHTVKSAEYWPGFLSEVIASADECESKDLFYVDATLAPGAETELQIHETEIALFVSRGTVLVVLVSEEDGESEAYVCERGTSGYVAPGEGFYARNIGDDEVEILMAHQGANSIQTAKGRAIEVPEHAVKLIDSTLASASA